MKTIYYKHFNENGKFVCNEFEKGNFTVRSAMKFLEENGFERFGSKKTKLHYVYVKPGITAYIEEW